MLQRLAALLSILTLLTLAQGAAPDQGAAWTSCGPLPDEPDGRVVVVAGPGDAPYPFSDPASCDNAMELFANVAPTWIGPAEVWFSWYCFTPPALGEVIPVVCQAPPPRRGDPSVTYAALVPPGPLDPRLMPPVRKAVIDVPSFIENNMELRRARGAEALRMYRAAKRYFRTNRPGLPPSLFTRYRGARVATYDDMVYGLIVIGDGFQGFRPALRRTGRSTWRVVAVNPTCLEGELDGLGRLPEPFGSRLLC